MRYYVMARKFGRKLVGSAARSRGIAGAGALLLGAPAALATTGGTGGTDISAFSTAFDIKAFIVDAVTNNASLIAWGMGVGLLISISASLWALSRRGLKVRG